MVDKIQLKQMNRELKENLRNADRNVEIGKEEDEMLGTLEFIANIRAEQQTQKEANNKQSKHGK